MEQNVQREFIVKSFKKPVEIILNFMLSPIAHSPQCEIFSIQFGVNNLAQVNFSKTT